MDGEEVRLDGEEVNLEGTLEEVGEEEVENTGEGEVEEGVLMNGEEVNLEGTN